MKISKPVVAQAQFIAWLKQNFPTIYNRAVLPAVEATQLGAEPEKKSLWAGILDNIASIGTAYLSFGAQKDLIEINVERAKLGQPPIDLGAAGVAPVVSTQVSLDPAMMAQLQATAKPALSIAMIGLLAVGAFFLLKR